VFSAEQAARVTAGLAAMGLDPVLVDDVITGCAQQVGEQSGNIGHNASLAAGFPESQIEARYRQAYAFAAIFSTGVMMPMGFEFGCLEPLNPVATTPERVAPEA
jgi:hypothetical protein